MAIVTCLLPSSVRCDFLPVERPPFFSTDSGGVEAVCRFPVTPLLTAFFAVDAAAPLSVLDFRLGAVFAVEDAAPPFVVAGFLAAVRFAAEVFFAVDVFFVAAFFAAGFVVAPFGLAAPALVVFLAEVFFAAAGFGLVVFVVFAAAGLARAPVPPEVCDLAVRSACFFGAVLPLVVLGLAARGAAESFD